MESNIKLTVRFNGTDFHGWQIQENALTVQECIVKAIERIIGSKVILNGCSRTDSGVHANMFCCNFRTEKTIDCKKIMRGLNAVLPDSVAVYGCEQVDYDFHSRFDCKGKI